MPSTGDRSGSTTSEVARSRRQVLSGLAGVPVLVVLVGCSGRVPAPVQSSPSPTAVGSFSMNPSPTEPPHVDAQALEATAAEALALLAAFDATVTVHPELGSVLAPFATDHDVHLDALAEMVPLPTTSPERPSTGTSRPAPTRSADPQTAEPTPTASPVPADAGAARAAVMQAEAVAAEAARTAARRARDGEAARLLASIGASRGVHALLLGTPT